MLDDKDWDELSDDDIEVFDSILDECLGIGLPVKTLKWHYRSKHEDLIAFSNQRFYDGAMITFPAAKAETDSLGVKLVYVPDGVYDRGGERNNPVEAEKVADLVFEHFKNYPKKTLGVVTFSIAQMDAVQEAIDRRIETQPEFDHFFKEDRLEGFFIKNLENVQGDERDVIFFSVGYGFDQNKQISMNFGPLNKPGGERRLNVAVTRAREKVVLITSIKGSDIDKDAQALGVQTLRTYLDYAEHGTSTLKSKAKEGAFDSPLDEDVANEIKKLGYQIVPEVGCSGYKIDIGVIDPVNKGCYLLGVECDGKTYQSSSSARDRDRLREQVLRQLGWRNPPHLGTRMGCKTGQRNPPITGINRASAETADRKRRQKTNRGASYRCAEEQLWRSRKTRRTLQSVPSNSHLQPLHQSCQRPNHRRLQNQKRVPLPRKPRKPNQNAS